MKRARIPALAGFLLILSAAAAAAQSLGEVRLVLNGAGARLAVPAGTAGVDTYWGVGPVSILASAPRGGTLRLTFDETGPGAAAAGRIALVTSAGEAWQDVDGTLEITLDRADNVPPNFDIAGRFEGQLTNGQRTVPASGTFRVLLPRENFAPTPVPD